MKRDVLYDAVALVEDAQHGDALRHWRHPGGARRSRSRPLRGCHRRILRLTAAVARREPEREQQRQRLLHAYSGIHGS